MGANLAASAVARFEHVVQSAAVEARVVFSFLLPEFSVALRASCVQRQSLVAFPSQFAVNELLPRDELLLLFLASFVRPLLCGALVLLQSIS